VRATLTVMLERFSQGKLTWVDLLNPTGDEIREVMEEANLPPELVHDLSAPVPRSGAVAHGGTVKVTLDYPIVKRTDINHPHEIKLLATKTHLITVHYEDIEALYRFRKEFELITILKTAQKRTTGGHLLIAVMNMLYNSLNAKLDYLESRLTTIEAEIFKEREREMVVEISQVSRRIISFRHVLASHKRILNTLTTCMEEVFSKEQVASVHELIAQFEFLTSRVLSIKETLSELSDTNFALLTTKQNEIMKMFTILAFITFPLTLFTSTFGMNTEYTPILGQSNDFWIIVAIMAVVSVFFFALFRFKRWI
jgi:magnesium transporter